MPTRAVLRVAKVQTAQIALHRVASRLVPGERLLPGYLVVGSKRSGTSSLQHYLTQHPDVLAPHVAKGSRFFDVHYDRHWSWYLSHFPRRRAAEAHFRRTGRPALTGEASPYYAFHPAGPLRIERHLPDVRVLLLVRDPVERAWSHYRYEVARGFEPLGIHDALDAEEARLAGEEDKLLADPTYRSFPHRHFSYLARGRYLEQLDRLTSCIAPERVLVLSSERLFADPAGTTNQAFRFLGLREFDGVDGVAYKANDAQAVPTDVQQRLTAYYEPHNRAFFDRLGLTFPWSVDVARPSGGPL